MGSNPISSAKRGLSRGSLLNIDFGPRTSRPTCINSGFLYLPEYPNGTGNRLKICRLNCLRVRVPSPVPYMPVWWNWYTRRSQTPLSKDVRVRVPPLAPKLPHREWKRMREMKVYNGKVYGVAVSNYDLEKGYLDYQTLAKIVGDCILNNTV